MTDKEAADFLRKANVVWSTPRRGGKTVTQILYVEAISMAINALEEKAMDLPVGERQRGEWKQITALDGQYYCYHKCTNCGQTIESGFDNPPIFNFCPQCGADMRKEGDS